MEVFLDTFEAHELTRFALKVSEQGRQCDEFSAAFQAIRTVIHLLLVNQRVQMLDQARRVRKLLVAYVTLP